MHARGVLRVARPQTLGRTVPASLTVFGRDALSLMNDEQRRWFSMHDRKLNTSEPSAKNSSRVELEQGQDYLPELLSLIAYGHSGVHSLHA
jgi:hypothetical protein